jgi:hypothetical protein
MTGNMTMLNIGLLVGSFTMTGNITMLNIGLYRLVLYSNEY